MGAASGGGFSAEALAIFAAFSSPPTDARKHLIDTAVVALKAAGVWAKIDALYMFAAADSQAALINWKQPGTFNATAVNTPTFTADRGFTGDAVSMYLDTNFNPATAVTPNFLQNSACVFGRALTNVAGTNIAGSLTSSAVLLNPRSATDLHAFRLNNATQASLAGSTNAIGFWSATRSGANATEMFKNGVSLFTDAVQTSASVVNQTITSMRNASTYFASQVASLGIAGHLNSTEQAALYAADLAYMQGVGAA